MASEALNAKIIASFFKAEIKDIEKFVEDVTQGIREITAKIDTTSINSDSKLIQALAEKIMPHIVNCDAIIQEKGSPSEVKKHDDENKATVANTLAKIAKTHAKPAERLLGSGGKQ